MPRLRNLFYGMAGAAEVMVLERRFLDADSWGFYFNEHIGDLVLFSSLTNELCLQRGGKRVILFAPEKFSFVSSLFPSNRITILNYVVNRRTWLFLPTRLIPQPGKISPMHPYWLFGVAGWNGTTAIDLYISYLNLDPKTSTERMRLPTEDEIGLAKKFMEDNELPEGKTVLLYPLTYSLSSLPEEKDGWNTIISELISAGYTVAVNVPKFNVGQIKFDYKVKLVYPPLELMRSIAILSGTVIARRSGIVDLLGELPIRMIVVYGCDPYMAAKSEFAFYSQKLMRTSDTVIEVCGGDWWKYVLRNML